LSKVFRGKFCSGLEQFYAEGHLEFHGQHTSLGAPTAFKRLLRQAVRHKWVVYAKQPFAGPRQVLAYLSRYTHRVALSPRRLLALDEQTQTVTFAWKDYADKEKRKTMRLELREFVRRFCLHLLPARFVKIRHFGFLSNRGRKASVAQARALLGQVTLPSTQVAASVEPIRICPYCGSCLLLLVGVVAPWIPAAPRPLDSS
jgi:hypothetical protein